MRFNRGCVVLLQGKTYVVVDYDIQDGQHTLHREEQKGVVVRKATADELTSAPPGTLIPLRSARRGPVEPPFIQW